MHSSHVLFILRFVVHLFLRIIQPRNVALDFASTHTISFIVLFYSAYIQGRQLNLCYDQNEPCVIRCPFCVMLRHRKTGCYMFPGILKEHEEVWSYILWLFASSPPPPTPHLRLGMTDKKKLRLSFVFARPSHRSRALSSPVCFFVTCIFTCRAFYL